MDQNLVQDTDRRTLVGVGVHVLGTTRVPGKGTSVLESVAFASTAHSAAGPNRLVRIGKGMHKSLTCSCRGLNQRGLVMRSKPCPRRDDFNPRNRHTEAHEHLLLDVSGTVKHVRFERENWIGKCAVMPWGGRRPDILQRFP